MHELVTLLACGSSKQERNHLQKGHIGPKRDSSATHTLSYTSAREVLQEACLWENKTWCLEGLRVHNVDGNAATNE